MIIGAFHTTIEYRKIEIMYVERSIQHLSREKSLLTEPIRENPKKIRNSLQILGMTTDHKT